MTRPALILRNSRVRAAYLGRARRTFGFGFLGTGVGAATCASRARRQAFRRSVLASTAASLVLYSDHATLASAARFSFLANAASARFCASVSISAFLGDMEMRVNGCC